MVKGSSSMISQRTSMEQNKWSKQNSVVGGEKSVVTIERKNRNAFDFEHNF